MIEILEALPIVLNYFVPGYIYLWVKRETNNERKRDNTDMFFLAIIATFVINIGATWIVEYVMQKSPMENVNAIYPYGSLIAIALAIVSGLLVNPASSSKIGKAIKKALTFEQAQYANLWNLSLDNSEWVTVYLDDLNVAYIGHPSYITSDPDNESRQLCLMDYQMFDMNNGNMLKQSSTELEGVLIDCKDSVRMEFVLKPENNL